MATPEQITCRHIYEPTNTPCGAKPGEPCQWVGFEKGVEKEFHEERLWEAQNPLHHLQSCSQN
jgi:hypothetical protein